MNTGNGSIKTSLSSRKDFQGSGMRACWQSTAGFWFEKLLPQGTKGNQAPNEGTYLIYLLLFTFIILLFTFFILQEEM